MSSVIMNMSGRVNKALQKIGVKALARNGVLIISRVDAAHEKAITRNLKGVSIERDGLARILVLGKGAKKKAIHGKVGVITVGTSDIPVAEEAKVVLVEMGCRVLSTYDVGVAGIRRPFPSIKTMIDEDVDAIVAVAVAGREGAMPTIIAGLVDVPGIGVPTFVGYGFGDKGQQPCNRCCRSVHRELQL